MNKLVLFLSCWAFCLEGIAQYAIINDPDGYTNVRKEQNSSSEVVGRLFDGEPFFIDLYNMMDEENDPLPEWVGIEYARPLENLTTSELAAATPQQKKAGVIRVSGYIHKSRISFVEKLTPMKRHAITDDLSIYSDGETSIMIHLGNFDKSAHALEGEEPYSIQKIDGSWFYGTDGMIPQREFRWIRIVNEDQVIDLPKEGFQFMYEIDFDRMNMYTDQKGHYYLPFVGGDGAGGYDACLAFDKKKITGRELWIP